MHYVFNPVAERMTGLALKRSRRQTRRSTHLRSSMSKRVCAAPSPVRLVLRDGNVVGLANHTALIAKDGSETPIDDTAAPIRDATGRLLGRSWCFMM